MNHLLFLTYATGFVLGVYVVGAASLSVSERVLATFALAIMLALAAAALIGAGKTVCGE